MFSACGRHQADRNILCPWNSTSFPHPVSTTHILLANCTATEIICARHLSQFTSTRTTQRDNASSTCDGLSFSHTSYHWGLFPQLPFVPEPLGAPVCDTYVPGHCTPEMVATLYSGVSTLSVRESSQICLDVPKDCDVGTGPILLPLKTFLQGQGHGVTDS